MNKLLKKLEKHALDGDEIIKMAKRKDIVYVYYDDLPKNTTTQQFFGKNKMKALLYTVKGQNIGHWILLGKKANGIYYFDPLGNKPESDIELSGENSKALSSIFKGMKVRYNKTKFQSEKSNTCGRHVAVRAKMFEMDDNEYKNFILNHHNINADDVVSLMTFMSTHPGNVIAAKGLKGGVLPHHSDTGIWYPL